MEGSRGSVRIGPISLFVLIIVLCLAVLAVLSLQTARAEQAITSQQAVMIEDTYANEIAGQELLSQVDAILAQGRNGTTNREDVLRSLTAFAAEKSADELLTVALESGSETEVVVTEPANDSDTYIRAEFLQESGRKLVSRIRINPDMTYTIVSWLVSTQWVEPGSDIVFWQG